MKRNNILIFGDLNSDLLFRGKTPQDTYLGRKLLKVLNSFNMKNIINKPARITADTSTIIDLIITSDKSKIKSQGCYDTDISDHHIVYAILNLYKKKSWPRLIEVKNYKDLDVESLKRDNEQAPLGICKLFDDVDDSTWCWEQLYKSILNSYVSTRKVKVRSKSLPWMNTEIRKEMNKRYKLLKKAQKHPKSSELWTEYRKQRNYVTLLKRKTEPAFWKNQLENTKNSKDFWKTVRQMQGKTNQFKIGPIQGVNKEIITDEFKKAEHINDYFSTVGEMLVKNIVHTDDIYSDATFLSNNSYD